jgi:Flp pilus assembly protein TadD
MAAAEAPPANPEAYRLYLQGRQQLARRGEEGLRAAIDLLERSIAEDPGFLRAHFTLAWASTLLANVVPAESEQAMRRMDRALATAARETAMTGEVSAVRAWLELERNHWIEADTALSAAIAESPDDTELRLLHSQMLGGLGNREAADREASQALANDPLSPVIHQRLAVLRLWAHDDRDAARLLAKARELGLAPSASPEVPMMLLARSRQFDKLAEALRDVQQRRGQSDDWVAAAIAAIRDPSQGPGAEAAMEKAAKAGEIDGLLHFGALVLAQRHERAVAWLLSRPALRTRELEFTLLSQEASGLRRLPAFPQVVTRFRLDTYWDRYGWPAQCARKAGEIRCI